MSRKDNLIVGLDIGTTKICAIVAETTEAGVDIVNLYGPATLHGYQPTDEELTAYFEEVLTAIKHPVTLAPNPSFGLLGRRGVCAETRAPPAASATTVASAGTESTKKLARIFARNSATAAFSGVSCRRNH